MKRRILLLLVLYIIPFFSFSQLKKIIVIDSVTKKTIQYANVKYLKSLKGTFTDSLGVFKIDKNFVGRIKVSVLGYESKILISKNIKDSIKLWPKDIILDEVVIGRNFEKDYGFHKAKGKYIGSSIKRAIVAIYIPNNNPDVVSYISRLHFKIKKRGKNISVVRPHLFSRNIETRIPEKELLDYNLLIKQKKNRKDIVSIDISDKKIVFPKKGIFIGLEWVGNTDDIDFGYNENNDSSNTLTLMTSNDFKKNIWIPMSPFGKNIVANFGITIYTSNKNEKD